MLLVLLGLHAQSRADHAEPDNPDTAGTDQANVKSEPDPARAAVECHLHLTNP